MLNHLTHFHETLSENLATEAFQIFMKIVVSFQLFTPWSADVLCGDRSQKHMQVFKVKFCVMRSSIVAPDSHFDGGKC